jgi:dienelactone hydrolase
VLPTGKRTPPITRTFRTTRARLGAALAAVVAAVLASGAPAGPTAPAQATPSARSHQAGIVEHDVNYASSGATLHGTVIAPVTGGRHPAVVVVAGAGSTGRDDYRPEAEAFARAGIVALVYDKRTGYSRAGTSMSVLATDALAGVALLATRSEVAPDRIGLWGHSQGGWVVPLAAASTSTAAGSGTGTGRVAFVVTVGASALPADRTQLWSNRTYLTHAGVAPRLVGPIGVNLSRILVGAGQFGDTTNDPYANLTRVHQPLLAIFGDRDRSTDPGESLPLFQRALQQAGNTHYTLRVIHGADHTMHANATGFTPDRPGVPFAPTYLTLTTTWINSLPAGPPPATADPAPTQTLTSTPTQPLSWYETPAVQLAALLTLLIAFLWYPIAALIRRLRKGDQRGSRSAVVVVVAGLGSVLGAAGYLFSVVAAGATNVQSTVLGRPASWLVLQLLAVTTVIAAALTGLRWWRARAGAPRPPRVRLAVLLAGAALFVPWAAYWGLLTA